MDSVVWIVHVIVLNKERKWHSEDGTTTGPYTYQQTEPTRTQEASTHSRGRATGTNSGTIHDEPRWQEREQGKQPRGAGGINLAQRRAGDGEYPTDGVMGGGENSGSWGQLVKVSCFY